MARVEIGQLFSS